MRLEIPNVKLDSINFKPIQIVICVLFLIIFLPLSYQVIVDLDNDVKNNINYDLGELLLMELPVMISIVSCYFLIKNFVLKKIKC